MNNTSSQIIYSQISRESGWCYQHKTMLVPLPLLHLLSSALLLSLLLFRGGYWEAMKTEDMQRNSHPDLVSTVWRESSMYISYPQHPVVSPWSHLFRTWNSKINRIKGDSVEPVGLGSGSSVPWEHLWSLVLVVHVFPGGGLLDYWLSVLDSLRLACCFPQVQN